MEKAGSANRHEEKAGSPASEQAKGSKGAEAGEGDLHCSWGMRLKQGGEVAQITTLGVKAMGREPGRFRHCTLSAQAASTPHTTHHQAPSAPSHTSAQLASY